MAGINPASGVRPLMPAGGLGGAPRADQGEKTGDFAKVLKTYVGEVDGKQHASYEAVKNLIAGRTQDVLPVVNAVAQADMSFKLLLAVRNKVIEAYKQTMNMQI